jgi:hypothetical protein
MSPLRILLAALLAATASLAQAAPAPLPKQERGRPTQTQLIEELRQWGVEVSVSAGSRPGEWVVTVWSGWRKPREPKSEDFIKVYRWNAKDRRAVLLAIKEGRVFEIDFTNH